MTRKELQMASQADSQKTERRVSPRGDILAVVGMLLSLFSLWRNVQDIRLVAAISIVVVGVMIVYLTKRYRPASTVCGSDNDEDSRG